MIRAPLEVPRREVPKGRYPVYLRKAEEFLAEAQDALLKKRFNAAAASAAHSAINALDSLTIHRLGARHAGPRHLDATFMLKYLDIPQKGEAEAKFEAAVNVKSAAEYEDRSVSKGEAEIAIKRAEQFLKWVKGNLPP
jgi:HEPN domain-containing protein